MHFPQKKHRVLSHKGLAVLAVGLSLMAAGVQGCGSDSTGLGDTGRMTVLLTDAPFPFDLVAEANVVIERVDVVGEFGVETIADGEQTFNLLDLQNGVTAVLGSASLLEGPISQIRLIVSSANVVLIDETTFDLFVPSGAQTGIKILTPGVDIAAGAETTTTLDMDVSESFIVQGNVDTPAGIHGFIFTPVVRVVGSQTDDSESTEDEGDSGEGGEDA